MKTHTLIATTKKGKRVFLEGIAKAGWLGGDTYRVEYTPTSIFLTKGVVGKLRKVTDSKGGVIDLESQAVARWAQDSTHCHVIYDGDVIVIQRNTGSV
jgi:hypothetical protein